LIVIVVIICYFLTPDSIVRIKMTADFEKIILDPEKISKFKNFSKFLSSHQGFVHAGSPTGWDSEKKIVKYLDERGERLKFVFAKKNEFDSIREKTKCRLRYFEIEGSFRDEYLIVWCPGMQDFVKVDAMGQMIFFIFFGIPFLVCCGIALCAMSVSVAHSGIYKYE